MIKTSKIKPNKANPRVIKDDKFRKLCASIEQFPRMMELRPIVVDKDWVVLGGNMRLKAIQHLGMKEIPDTWVVCADDLTDEQKKEFIIKDNVGFGEWDWDTLANEWDAADLIEWGLDVWDNMEDKTPEEPVEASEDDFDEETDAVETICKRGDIWQLGDHRLMCGDSLDEKSVLELLCGNTTSLTFTDPPYRLITDGGGIYQKSHSMKQVEQNGVDEFDPLRMKLYSKTNIFCHNRPLIKDYILLAEREREPFDLCVYKKQGLPNYNGHMMTDIEYIAIIGEQSPRQGFELSMYSKVFEGKKDKGNDLSYSKPIALCDKFIRLYSDEQDSVLDLFGGSGSTMMAAEQLHRKCYMMELDPHYCDVIIARWTKLTNKSAVKIKNIGD